MHIAESLLLSTSSFGLQNAHILKNQTEVAYKPDWGCYYNSVHIS